MNTSRLTQPERRARTREALLGSAALHIARSGYGGLVLEQVARDAGYTRGALYHQFADKDDLTLAALSWVNADWQREVGALIEADAAPVETLLTLARGHAVYCRRDVARFAMNLRMEFAGREHPVAAELDRISASLVERCARLVRAGRRDGSIPPGPPARAVALGLAGALEGAVIFLAGQAPHDVTLAERAVAGVLGLQPST